MAAKKAPKTMTFEEGLEKLEGIAVQMEKSELPLDELLKLYEEGMKLSADLTHKLDEIDGRMQEVRAGKDGAPVTIQTDIVRQGSLLDGLDE